MCSTKSGFRQALCRRSGFRCCSRAYFDNFHPAQLETLLSGGRDVAKLARPRPTGHASPHAHWSPAVTHMESCQNVAECSHRCHSKPAEEPPSVTARQGPRHVIIDFLQFVDLRTLIERGLDQFRLELTRFPLPSATQQSRQCDGV
jgi:hypothetical protein